MKIENLFILSLLLITLVFLVIFFTVISNKRKQKVEVSGYQLKKGHLDFHIAYVKKYPGFTLAFFPLVEAKPLASFHSANEKKSPAVFKGMACLLEVKVLDKNFSELLLEHFDRIEEQDMYSYTLYKEEINFLTLEMKTFVEEIDRELTQWLKESSPEVLL